MQTFVITAVRKLGVNQFTEEETVGIIEADLLGVAKRNAGQYILNWLTDRKIRINTQSDWVKDVKRGGMSREMMVSEDGKPVKMIFILREQNA